MIDFAVANGDLVLDNNNNFVTVNNDVAQEVYIEFSTWLGDWFFDTTFGIDYTKLPGNQQETDLMIKSKLLSIPGVVSIVSFNSILNPETRFYSFSVVFTDTNGDTQEITV